MNLGHLGDRLDYCKRFILGELERHGLLQDLAIDAMATSPQNGVPMTQLYMDEVRFDSDNGCNVTLVKCLQ